VLKSIFNDWFELWRATLDTATASLIGFGLSAAFGCLIAIALSSAAWVQRAFYPYAVFFQTVPIIAIAPLLVIWFGWDRTVVASAFIVSIFPVIANTLTGLLSTDPALRDLFRLYEAKRLALLFKLRLPFALPHILTGLRIAAGLAIIGAIVGEFITGAGIGGAIMVSRQQNRVDKVFAGLLLASLLGIVLFIVINIISRVALRHWHASEAQVE
jgi:NitT/TauT family transport system permease protein